MNVLVIAPHADDETLGCGGTIARLTAEGNDVTVAVMTGHGNDAPHPLWPREAWNTVRAEAAVACARLGVKQLLFREVPAVLAPDIPTWALNRETAQLIDAVRPEVLYVPFLYDLHGDHRVLFHSLSVAWRPTSAAGRGIREVYAYEVQSETHWNAPYLEPGFLPNVYVDITNYLETKLDAFACYRSQVRPAPDARSIEALRALAVWRGSLVGLPAAEAFVLVKKVR